MPRSVAPATAPSALHLQDDDEDTQWGKSAALKEVQSFLSFLENGEEGGEDGMDGSGGEGAQATGSE